MEGRDYAPELLSQPEDIALAVSAALKIGSKSEITDIRIRPMQPVSPPKLNPEKAYDEPDLAAAVKVHGISLMQQISVVLPAATLI